MINKIKKTITKLDRFLFKVFGTEENIKFLENLKEAKIIFSYLNEMGEDTKVRFVGGCVRKAIIGEQIDDIDLATSLEPSDVKKRLNDKDIKVIDTGISHGTLTIIINKKKFEITTLRKDHLTDGRHAKVEFTKDWEIDSFRRDLTINAIYADIDGKIFDPQNGISDLKSGVVKFIGLPELRIQEDYLRILRYFRFFNQYSKIEHEKNIIQSIKKNINGLNKISNERLFDELKKILSSKKISELFLNKHSIEIFLHIFPQFKFYKRLDIFNSLSRTLKESYDYKIILALLIIDKTDNYDFFCYKYKLPNHIKKLFQIFSNNFKNLEDKKFYEIKNIKKLIYFHNREIVQNILLFSICINKKLKEIDLKKLLSFIYKCEIPTFPISGDDLKKHGYTSGPILGNKLKSLEEKWIENNFVMDEKLLDKFLNKKKN